MDNSARISDKRVSYNVNRLCDQTGYRIWQNNGQRIYEPKVKLASPPKGCEVFIGRIPKTIFEDILIPVFLRAGPLYKFRLMLEYNDRGRGYAFATYFKKEHADIAVAKFNDYEIRPRVRIAVYKSVDNRRLFIGNIPKEISKLEVYCMLSSIVEGIVEIIMYMDVDNENLNRGFVFVEFEDHRYAAIARRKIAPKNLLNWDRVLKIDWADPIPEVDTLVMSQVTILFMKNLPLTYTSIELKAILANYIAEEAVKKVHKFNNYAFIHFSTRKNAEIVLKKLTGLRINNVQVIIEWAIPRNYSKKNQMIHGPTNFCLNVPLNTRFLVHKKIKSIKSDKVPMAITGSTCSSGHSSSSEEAQVFI